MLLTPRSARSNSRSSKSKSACAEIHSRRSASQPAQGSCRIPPSPAGPPKHPGPAIRSSPLPPPKTSASTGRRPSSRWGTASSLPPMPASTACRPGRTQRPASPPRCSWERGCGTAGRSTSTPKSPAERGSAASPASPASPTAKSPASARPSPSPTSPVSTIRQEFGLGGEKEQVKSDQNQLAGFRDISRFTVAGGKFGAADFFDGNGYSHDPRIAVHELVADGHRVVGLPR